MLSVRSSITRTKQKLDEAHTANNLTCGNDRESIEVMHFNLSSIDEPAMKKLGYVSVDESYGIKA